jgi:alpha-glucosidase
MPYLYTAFAEAHKTGMPVNRTMVIDNTTDENCWRNEFQQQYMFGPSIMVAPVESSKEIVKVYLPQGNWFDFFNGKQYDGSQEIMTECPLEKLPVFVKGGSFIPMQTIVQSTSEKPSDTLFLHVYFGKESSVYNYYEDDGLTYDYEKGAFLESKMSFVSGEKKIIIEPLVAEKYNSKFKTISLVLHGFEPVASQLKANGKAVQPAAATIDLFNAVYRKDAVYLDSPEMTQKVLVISGLKANEKSELSW